MNYCDIASVLCKWNNADIETELVTPCITQAESIIDAMLCERYTVPFTGTIPPLITTIATNIAVFFLKSNKDPRLIIDSTGAIDLNFRLAMDWLTQLQKGTMNLPGIAKIDNAGISSTTEDFQPIHDLDDEEFHNIDSDRLEQIEERRNE
jgi:phage gp36-like protein